MSRFVYGLDFGTSNTALSILDLEEQKILHTFNEASLIYFPDDTKSNYLTGKKALADYVENARKGRLIKSIKSILPRSTFTHTTIHKKHYKAEDLVALLLSYFKQLADDWVGEEVDTVVMGRPVVFSKDKEKDVLAEERLHAAAKLAGFKHISSQFEPVAAAYSYERALQKEERVLVADFGAGTSDFTVMALSPGGKNKEDRKADFFGRSGIHIGGDDFDSNTMWKKMVQHFGYGLKYRSFGKKLDVPLVFFKKLCTWEDMDFFHKPRNIRGLEDFYFLTQNHPKIGKLLTLIKGNFGFQLFRAVEKAKMELSDKENSRILFNVKDINIEEAISEEEFADFQSKEMKAIRQCLSDFLLEIKMTPKDIDTVFITGGSSKVRVLQRLLADVFGQDKIRSGDAFNSVANGLAWTVFEQGLS